MSVSSRQSHDAVVSEIRELHRKRGCDYKRMSDIHSRGISQV
jgi:hypothetical protein